MLEFLNNPTMNQLEVFKSVMNLLFLLSASGVVLGVIFEGKSFSSRVNEFGWKLLVASLALELVFTVAIFGTDEQISHIQRAEISAQQQKIEQLIVRRKLSSEQKERLASVAKQFPSLNFVTITALDDESWGFVMEIAAELKRNGWNWIPCDGPLPKLVPMDGRPLSCWTVLNHIQIDGSQNLADVVHLLETAIRDPAILGMADVRPEISPAFPTIAIMVGTKR